MRTSRRKVAGAMVALAVSATLIATLPVGTASAHDNGSSSCSSHRGNDHDDDLDCLTAAQASAVKQARATYIAKASSIMKKLKADLRPDRARFSSEIAAELKAKEAAKAAYKAAFDNHADPATLAELKAKYEATDAAYDAAARRAYAKYTSHVTEETAEAKVDLAQAAVVYTKAINAAFTPDSPPPGLLRAPGGRFDYGTFTPGWFGFHGDDHGHHRR